MDSPAAIVWFRNDLRLHDHQPLTDALSRHRRVVLLFCFDSADDRDTPFGFQRVGPHRRRFQRQSVSDLRRQIRRLGGELLIRQGKPAEAIDDLLRSTAATNLYAYAEPGTREHRLEERVVTIAAARGCDVHWSAGRTLLHVDDLPFPVSELPELFTEFRKRVEKRWHVRRSLAAPTSLVAAAVDPCLSPGEPSDPVDVRIDDHSPGPLMSWRGGETEGLSRLQQYVWQHDRLRVYKESRNGMLSPWDSSRLSAWLSMGCLSPRRVYEEVKRYEAERIKNDSTYWLVFELLWRDYFAFILQKHGSKLFRESGIQGISLPWRDSPDDAKAWREGRTGYPLVDANMRELSTCGYLSNRGRQNVASFMTKNLRLDWRMGAQWFESQLIDHDVASNYGNWNYVAGVGNDARGFRFFNITKQANDYDPSGDYVRHWLPELAGVPGPKVHEPWKLSAQDQQEFGVRIGIDYPLPLVDLFQSADENRRLYELACS